MPDAPALYPIVKRRRIPMAERELAVYGPPKPAPAAAPSVPAPLKVVPGPAASTEPPPEKPPEVPPAEVPPAEVPAPQTETVPPPEASPPPQTETAAPPQPTAPAAMVGGKAVIAASDLPVPRNGPGARKRT